MNKSVYQYFFFKQENEYTFERLRNCQLRTNKLIKKTHWGFIYYTLKYITLSTRLWKEVNESDLLPIPYNWKNFRISKHHSGTEWTWEQWQWRSIQLSPKLQHYWNFTIWLFHVISRTHVCKETDGEFYCPSRQGNKMLSITLNEYRAKKNRISELNVTNTHNFSIWHWNAFGVVRLRLGSFKE